MDFIKKLFEGADGLSYDAFMQRANEAGIKFANLSEGNYVSKIVTLQQLSNSLNKRALTKQSLHSFHRI